MDKPAPQPAPTGRDAVSRSPWPWLLSIGCLLVILLGILLPRPDRAPANQSNSTNVASRAAAANATALERAPRLNHFSSSVPTPDAPEIVAGKVSRFAHDRLGVVQAMAKHYKVEVPNDVARFFAAGAIGRWEEVKDLFASDRKSVGWG